VAAQPVDFLVMVVRQDAICRSAEDSRIDERLRDDPELISEIPGPRIASRQNGFLWNQRLSRKLLITLAR
jgi:hypothetical protein